MCWLLLSTEADETEGVVSTWLGVPMYFSSFGLEAVVRLAREAGFEIVEAEIEGQVEGGEEIGYLWLVGQRGCE